VRANFLKSVSSPLETRIALEKDGISGSYYLTNERDADDTDERDLLACGHDLVGLLPATRILDEDQRRRISR
jgi:hypothetical protein